MLVGSSEDLSLLDPLISETVPVFARLGHLLEVKVSIRVIILSVTGNIKGRAGAMFSHSQLALSSDK